MSDFYPSLALAQGPLCGPITYSDLTVVSSSTPATYSNLSNNELIELPDDLSVSGTILSLLANADNDIGDYII